MKRKIASVLLLVSILAGTIASAGAQQGSSNTGNGFRVSPVREELTINPGTSQTVTLTVENVSGAPIIAHPLVNDFQPSTSEDGNPRLLLDQGTPISGNSFVSLVQQPLPSLPLQPGQHKEMKVTLNVPKNAAGGGYYGAIRFTPQQISKDKQVSLTASVGVIFLIKVPGNISEQLELLTLAAGQGTGTSSVFLSSPDKTVVRLKNTGNIHEQPFGKISVKDWRGKVISTQEFNNVQPRDNVLPGSIRRFETPLNAKANFGRYTIEANLGYGSNNSQLISASVHFWVFPIWFVISVILLIVIVVVSVSFWVGLKRNRRYR